MAGFTAINQSSETATGLNEAVDRFRRDVPHSTVNNSQKAGVASGGTPDSTKNMPTHRSSLYANHLPTKGFLSNAYQTSSDHKVQRGTEPSHFGYGPSVPASCQRGEQFQDNTRTGRNRQSPTFTEESPRGNRAARFNFPESCPSSNSQAPDPRKRRVRTENPNAVEMLRTPRKKSKKRHTVPPIETPRPAYPTVTTRVSDFKLPLSSDRTLELGAPTTSRRRCQPCREVKIMPTIEHQIDPENPRHSAHPWDDPLIQYLNEDDTSHHCSQVKESGPGKSMTLVLR